MDDTPPTLAGRHLPAGHQLAGADAVDIGVAGRRRRGRGCDGPVRRGRRLRRPVLARRTRPVPRGLLLPGRTRAGRRHHPGGLGLGGFPRPALGARVTAAGRRTGLGRAGGRWRSLPESARRDPLRSCGAAAGIGRPAWARVLGACGSVRLFRRPAGGIVAWMAAVGVGAARPRPVVHAVAAGRVVVRGRPGWLRRPAGGRVAAVRWGRKMFPQKVVAVGHGVNPDCACMVSSGAV